MTGSGGSPRAAPTWTAPPGDQQSVRPDGNRTYMYATTGYALWFDHDGLDRMTAIREGTNVVVRIGYDSAGRRTTVGMGNEGWVSSSATYTYDPVSRLQGLDRHIGGTSADQIIRVRATTRPRRSRSPDRHQRPPTPGAAPTRSTGPMPRTGSTSIRHRRPGELPYDANGNLTSDGSTAFVYDAENRLVSASGAKSATLALRSARAAVAGDSGGRRRRPGSSTTATALIERI
jgi:YD repeat-containing protein